MKNGFIEDKNGANLMRIKSVPWLAPSRRDKNQDQKKKLDFALNFTNINAQKRTAVRMKTDLWRIAPEAINTIPNGHRLDDMNVTPATDSIEAAICRVPL